MNDAAKLKQAQELAKQLKPIVDELTPKEKARLSVINGIGRDCVEELQLGWSILDKLRVDREEVDYPLPDTGCFLLGYESVIAGCLAELHTALAEMLRLGVSSIAMKIEKDDDGHFRPVADISVPDDWIIPVVKDPRHSPKEAARLYIEECLNAAQVTWKIMISERLQACDTRRTDVMQVIAE